MVTKIMPSDPRYQGVAEAQARLTLFINRHCHFNLTDAENRAPEAAITQDRLEGELANELATVPPSAFAEYFK